MTFTSLHACFKKGHRYIFPRFTSRFDLLRKERKILSADPLEDDVRFKSRDKLGVGT